MKILSRWDHASVPQSTNRRGNTATLKGLLFRGYLNPMSDNRTTTGSTFDLFSSMAHLSLVTFLALAFSGVVFAAPQDLGASGDIRARDVQKYYDFGTWVPASKDPTHGTYDLIVQGALTPYCPSMLILSRLWLVRT